MTAHSPANTSTLAQRRRALRMRQIELARKARVSQQAISLIEVNHNRPSPKVARRIATALGIPAVVLFPPRILTRSLLVPVAFRRVELSEVPR